MVADNKSYCLYWRWHRYSMEGWYVCQRHGIHTIPSTALALEGERPFMITEALRGEGGVILDGNGLKNGKKMAQKTRNFLIYPNYSPLVQWQQEI